MRVGLHSICSLAMLTGFPNLTPMRQTRLRQKYLAQLWEDPLSKVLAQERGPPIKFGQHNLGRRRARRFVVDAQVNCHHLGRSPVKFENVDFRAPSKCVQAAVIYLLFYLA